MKKTRLIFIDMIHHLLSDINECDDNPCENGGTCHDTVGSFICLCAAGYDRDTCQNGKELSEL